MSENLIEIHDRKGRRRFITCQGSLYGCDPNYIPPLIGEEMKTLDPAGNPFFSHAETALWILERQGKVVGRISATRDQAHDEYNNEKAGFFGHFEALDRAAAKRLLDQARTWLTARGAHFMRGPISLSTNHRCGLLIEGFDGPPVVEMNYNPPHYREWLEDYGLEKTKDLLSLQLIIKTAKMERMATLADKITKRKGLTSRPLNKKNFAGELRMIMEIYNQAWKDNWGFIPLNEKEFLFQAESFKPLVSPQLCRIVEARGKAAGFVMAIPDVNPAIRACNGRLFPFGFIKFLFNLRKADRCRVLLLGVKEEFRHQGIEALLMYQAFNAAKNSGYSNADLSWILEDNQAMLRPLERADAKVWRRFRLFQQSLET